MMFSKGVHKCRTSTCRVYLITAALVRIFNTALLETDDSNVAFVNDFQVTLPKLDSKSVRVAATSRKGE
jgi:hypothetical protein